MLLQELGALIAAMPIIHPEPLHVVLQHNGHFVLVVLAVGALVGDCRVAGQVGLQGRAQGLGDLGKLLAGAGQWKRLRLRGELQHETGKRF